MKNVATPNETIAAYYDDLLTKKNSWESLLAGDVKFTGPGKTHNGKDAFLQTLAGFLKNVTDLRVKHAIVTGSGASVIASYDLVTPKGKSFSIDVAEIWEIREQQLSSLTIFFDTAMFREAMM